MWKVSESGDDSIFGKGGGCAATIAESRDVSVCVYLKPVAKDN